jgi:SNF2 family DNA or RNA helicase
MASSNRKIANFGTVPEGAEVIDIDDIPDSYTTYADNDEDIKVAIKVEPGTETPNFFIGLGNSILKPKQSVPPPKPMDSENHHAQQAMLAQFLTYRENPDNEQDPSEEQLQDSSEPEEQTQNPVEQEFQYLQDETIYMQKKQAGLVSQEDELEFMKKTSAYNKRKRDLAALMEDDDEEEEDDDPLFEPPEEDSESGNNAVQSDKRPKKKARTSKPRSRKSIPRVSKLGRPAIPNLRGHTEFWENSDAVEQMQTEPDYVYVEGGRGPAFKALREKISKAGRRDLKRLKAAASSFTNTKGVGKRMKGFKPDNQGWTIAGMVTPLKNYQIINCGWMRRQEMRTNEPKGGILADQMGLGKTVTCIANIVNGRPLKTYLPHLRSDAYTTLIVVPSSLLGQWRTEIKRHTKSETRRRERGLGSIHEFRDSASEKHEPVNFSRADIVLTTYNAVRSSWPAHEIPEGLSEAERTAFFMENIYEKRGPLHRFEFLRIVLDEGHGIANPDTLTAKACFNLVAKHKWVLTGTP